MSLPVPAFVVPDALLVGGFGVALAYVEGNEGCGLIAEGLGQRRKRGVVGGGG